MGDMTPGKPEETFEMDYKSLISSGTYYSVTRETPNPYYSHFYVDTEYPKISIDDVKNRKFHIVDRELIGTPLVRVERGWERLLSDPHRCSPARALVLSFHEPEEPAEILFFWADDVAVRAYEDWKRRMDGVRGPWELTLYMVGHDNYLVPGAEDPSVFVNQNYEVVDVEWPNRLAISRSYGAGFLSWRAMAETPPESKNPCSEIMLCAPSTSSLAGIARKLLPVEELPAGALITYERMLDKSENPEKPLADEGKPL